MDINFAKIPPCGGNCEGCGHFQSGECAGCIKTGGKCVKMWDNGCEIFSCCEKQGVKFCGLCGEFPCEWLKSKVAEWDKDGIGRLASLAEEYRRRSAVFSEQLPSLWEKIGTHGVMTLSTCSEGRVTSRSMSVVVINGKFYCQTDENYLNRQLRENPSAALCVGSFSIEGVCRIIGKPLQHEAFMAAMRKHFPSAAERWSEQPSECVLELTPRLIYSWIYENDIPYTEYWDFENMTYHKERK